MEVISGGETFFKVRVQAHVKKTTENFAILFNNGPNTSCIA